MLLYSRKNTPASTKIQKCKIRVTIQIGDTIECKTCQHRTLCPGVVFRNSSQIHHIVMGSNTINPWYLFYRKSIQKYDINVSSDLLYQILSV